ncbi:hypothetical protein [Nitrospira sp. BLG_1]|uniref:hypothetical protein n=1 Tax=Nitrospira sp. BLG_1 TaxID=3395883 RepID=UPI0039BD8A4E
MRQILVLLAVVTCASITVFAMESHNAAVAGKSRISACALLTEDLVTKFDTTPPHLRQSGVLKQFKPTEEPVGPNGSYCDDGQIGLQVNPFSMADELRKSPGKDWQPVSGVGDTAFFHNNRDQYAELMVWTGPHHFTIQLSVPVGGTADSIKSNVIGLANGIIPKLRGQ